MEKENDLLYIKKSSKKKSLLPFFKSDLSTTWSSIRTIEIVFFLVQMEKFPALILIHAMNEPSGNRSLSKNIKAQQKTRRRGVRRKIFY